MHAWRNCDPQRYNAPTQRTCTRRRLPFLDIHRRATSSPAACCSSRARRCPRNLWRFGFWPAANCTAARQTCTERRPPTVGRQLLAGARVVLWHGMKRARLRGVPDMRERRYACARLGSVNQMGLQGVRRSLCGNTYACVGRRIWELQCILSGLRVHVRVGDLAALFPVSWGHSYAACWVLRCAAAA